MLFRSLIESYTLKKCLVQVVRWFIQLLNEDFLLQTAAANITSHMNNHHEHMMRLEEHIGMFVSF